MTTCPLLIPTPPPMHPLPLLPPPLPPLLKTFQQPNCEESKCLGSKCRVLVVTRRGNLNAKASNAASWWPRVPRRRAFHPAYCCEPGSAPPSASRPHPLQTDSACSGTSCAPGQSFSSPRRSLDSLSLLLLLLLLPLRHCLHAPPPLPPPPPLREMSPSSPLLVGGTMPTPWRSSCRVARRAVQPRTSSSW